MYVDYHNHTVLCNHATGTVDQYLERAAEQGIAEFGFAEHSHWMLHLSDRRLAPDAEGMALYLQWMDERREKWNGKAGRPLLRVGLEADWLPDQLDLAREFTASYPFDYIIGSVHHIRDPETGMWTSSWHVFTKDVDAFYREYFSAIRLLAESGLCDIIGHIDVPRRSGYVPVYGVLPFVEEILPSLKKSGVAVEINASGPDHRNADLFPCQPVLDMLVAAGIPITFGSDAHRPEQVGRYRERVFHAMKAAGAREFVRFDKREKLPTPLVY